MEENKNQGEEIPAQYIHETGARQEMTPPGTEPILATYNLQPATPMEVHHPHHVHHSKKWKDYLFEFLMLFLAVTSGFFMENQREHYVESQRVKEYARSLVHDLGEDTVMIKETISRMKNAMKNITRFAAFVKGKELKDIRNIDLYYYTVFLDGYRPYTWNRATFEQIKNSGSLRYFTNESIVNRISNYDAFTRHMDEDYIGDQGRSDRTLEKKSQVIDLNYPDEFFRLLRLNGDSTMTTPYYREMVNLDLSLLAKDITGIKTLTNEKLIIKAHLSTRIDDELPRLVEDAAKLIQLLKTEYHLE
jgi:hypothetical protein